MNAFLSFERRKRFFVLYGLGKGRGRGLGRRDPKQTCKRRRSARGAMQNLHPTFSCLRRVWVAGQQAHSSTSGTTFDAALTTSNSVPTIARSAPRVLAAALPEFGSMQSTSRSVTRIRPRVCLVLRQRIVGQVGV